VPERAAHFYLRAARAARRVYASATAIASYELAVDGEPDVGVPSRRHRTMATAKRSVKRS